MPIPPPWAASKDWLFIINYWLIGCSPPYWIVFDVTKVSQKRLLALILAPDAEDIIQGVFDPGKRGDKTPKRRGRKRPGLPGLPDISDLISDAIRAEANPHNVLKISTFRYLFKVWNIFEGLSFLFAIIDLSGDVYYEHLLGVIESDPLHCIELHRLNRKRETPHVKGGQVGQIQDVNISPSVYVNGFYDSAFLTDYPEEYSIVVTAYAYPYLDDTCSGQLVLHDGFGNEYASSGIVTIGPGSEGEFMEVFATIPSGVCAWGWRTTEPGFLTLYHLECFAIDNQGLPIP